MSSLEVPADSPSMSSHRSNLSSVSQMDFVTADEVAGEDVADLASPDASRPVRAVELWWSGAPFSRSLRLFASHDGFAEAVEMEGSEEKGWSATVAAPVGQDLLYRFEVDGEMQPNEEAQIMQLNGEEYNVLHVPENEDEAAPSPTNKKQTEDAASSPPAHNRRQSTHIVWDNERSTLLIEDDSKKKGSSKHHSRKNSMHSERFVGMGSDIKSGDAVQPPSASGNDDDGDESGDEETTVGPGGELTRTKRKNQKHRAKLKQEKLQSPKYSASGFAFQTPMSTPQRHNVSTPGGNQHATMMEINKLKMENMQRENEWKEAWIAHELQTFKIKEEERATLKAQMNEERARWLSKLKEYTAELKTVRDDNLQLKTDLAAAQAATKVAKNIEKSTAKRSDKFQTLQRNMLNEEMLVWIADKNKLSAEIEVLKGENADAKDAIDELRKQLQTASTHLSTIAITLQSKEREIATLADEKASLIKQLAAGAQDSESSVKSIQAQLAEAQSKHSDETRAANVARSEAAMLAAQLEAIQKDLAAKIAESEAAKVSGAAKVAAQETAIASLKLEAATLQQKLLQAQEESFKVQTELEQAQLDREAAEQRESELENQIAVRVSGYEQALAQARSASVESGSKIVALNYGVRELRGQLSALGQVQLRETQQLLKQMGDAQTFLVDALQVQSTLLNSTMRKYKREMSERRKLHNVVQELRGNIRVYCRTRPLSAAEAALEGGNAITIQSDMEAGEVATELSLRTEKGAQKVFEFDAVFGPTSTQSEVFTQIVSLVTSVLDGYSCCLFAYGQTGAGKTHTMSGTPSDPGMNLRSLTELFRLRDERREDVNYEISVSFYEVYNENLYDLLDTNREKELKIRQGPTGVYVEGLVDRRVESEADVLQLVAEGSKNRTVGATSMNAGSSRSHSILSVQVHGHSSVMGVQLRGTLHLIDLAGSERVGRSNATGERLKEAQAINLSLSALGNCIEALQKKQSHVPYRNSKLTFILQNSLGGHAKTLMMVNVSPAAQDVEETICSLQFATRVRATELGSASKNVSAASSSSSDAGASGEPAEKAEKAEKPAAKAGVTSPPTVKRPATATSAAAAAKPRAATATPVKPAAAAAGSAVKKPVTAAAGSAVKKPLAK